MAQAHITNAMCPAGQVVTTQRGGRTTTSHSDVVRNWLTFLIRMHGSTLPPHEIFSDKCADETGMTVERKALEDALKRRKIRVLKWPSVPPDGVIPALFPPQWVESTRPDLPTMLLAWD